MSEITQETLNWAYKPFDIVTTKNGDVGFITEVSVNTGQEDPMWQIQYSIEWLVGDEDTTAWWDHNELKLHCNLFIKMAETMCHPMGNNSCRVQDLFNSMNRASNYDEGDDDEI